MKEDAIEILMFGVAREITGQQKVKLALPLPSRVCDVKKELLAQYPRLSDLSSMLVAVNQKYAQQNDLISENDEIAVIPPVSGG